MPYRNILTALILLTVLAAACAPLTPVVTRMAQPTPTAVSPLISPTARTSNEMEITKLAGSERKDVPYCTIRGTDLTMDMVYPRSGGGPYPVVVYIHGGGWSEGDKADMTGSVGVAELLENGYLLVSINYRMAPSYRFPSMIEDARCAVRSLRAHAGEWGVDPERIGAMGASAGGHLAALLGTAGDEAAWEADLGYDEVYLDQSSQVQAVVDLFGPADLPALFASSAQNLAQSVFGVRRAGDPFLADASPLTYVSAGDAPFLILHGTRDLQVPLKQSEDLHESLQAAGVESTLVVVENAGHGFPRSGQEYTPGFDDLGQKIVEFLDRHLQR